ncbi:MAG: 4Fe-4S ferredoxin [Deltaproteobacteria bacterium]|nr:4Fe-4S ferredoxin [Deltaproteobacteria bacterium]
MATMINGSCINCGACEPVCPRGGIVKGEEIYVIDPSLCTECVGFHPQQQCASVCPITACCVQDPERVETEELLFERALKICADEEVPPVLSADTSHFRAASLPWWKRLILGI